MYRIEVTLFNRYDPDDLDGFPNVGIEVYTWHGGGLPWLTGGRMISATLLSSSTRWSYSSQSATRRRVVAL